MFPKSPHGTRKQIKARERRREHDVIQTVRPQCVARDGYCRLNVTDSEEHDLIVQFFGDCSGWSEWAHIGEKRRAHTRGMDPEDRHTTEDSLMLCKGHHVAYDANKFRIEKVDPARGANGPLRVVNEIGEIYQEAAA